MKIQWNNENKEKMNIHDENGVTYLSFPLMDQLDFVTNGFTTRLGGVSEGYFASMNLSFTRGDQEEHVMENYRKISNAMGFPLESIVTSDQTHTTNVIHVTAEDKGNGITKPRPYTDVDGMITDEPEVTLATFYADCVPLYFADPVRKAIGLSHSGWRGTVGKIGKVTIESMAENFGCKREDIKVAIGPSICQECYEVSEDVIGKFQESFSQKDWDDLFYKKENGKYQLDLWKANELVFLESGIKKDNIAFPNLCTCCNPKLLFSHRASHGKRGNLAAFLKINS